MVAVEALNAFFAYKERVIFKGLNFAAGRGEIFCLLGPNGCGKTTLLDCILGLHTLQSGTIRVLGRDNRQVKPHALARSLAYVPQRHAKAFPYTVKEIVIMGRAAHLNMFAAPSGKDAKIADASLELLDIAHLSGRPYTKLSGGETQLVMIARALAQQSPVIVMDEPTAHLDFRHELIILEMITRLVKDRKLSVIMATHFPNHAFYFQNAGVRTTAALLHNQGFLAMGPPDRVVDEKAIKKLYGVDAKVISVPNDKDGILNNIVPLRTAKDKADSV